MKEYNELLEEASRKFRSKDWKKSKLSIYDFILAKFPYGYVFKVINDWHKWSDKGLETEFGAYQKPEHAIQAFLDYVKENKINVKKLTNY